MDELCEVFPSYELDPCTCEMVVRIPDMAWNPYIRQSKAFKNRR